MYRCSSLVSITIPKGVTEIGTHAFYYCEKLAIVNCLIDVPPSVTTQTFEGISSTAILNVSSSSENYYKQKTEWTEHFNSIHVMQKNFSINVAVAGSLPELISNAEQSFVEELTLTGSLNGTDIVLIRKLAGTVSGNYCLKKLDLTNAKIVYGGSAYYSYTELGSLDDVVTISYSTKDDQITAYMFMNCKNLLEIKIPSNITNIGNNAFQGCTNLEIFSAPNNVKSIGSFAFEGCSSLLTISIPNSVTSIYWGAFSGCSNLSSINIPDSVTSIESNTFNGCSSLTSINIPNSVTSIGNGSFKDCSSLTFISIPNSVTTIAEDAFLGTGWYNSQKDGILYLGNWLICYKGNFAGQIIIPNGIVGIANSALKGCLGLNSVKLPGSVLYIGSLAFYGCSGLTSLMIDEGITTIGYSAFSGCSGITSLTIPNSVTSIGESAFSNCSRITSLIIGEKVTSIGNYAFSGCSGITSLIIGENVTSIGESSFSDCSGITSLTIGEKVTTIGRWAFYGCSSIESLTIPNSVTSIGNSAFYGCSGITSLTIGAKVTSIGNYAFSGCSNMESLAIPNSVTSIGESAFSGCSGITSLSIGEKVTSIGNYAFSGCSGITSLTIGEKVTTIDYRAFNGCSGITSLTIPSSVTSIGYEAFYGCSSLSSIVVSSDNPIYDSRNNSNAIIETASNTLVLGCLNSIIPNTVTSIGSSSFKGCGLINMNIPNSVTSIGYKAFDECSSLTNLTIGKSVKEIKEYAFRGCSSLKTFVSLNRIPPQAYKYYFDEWDYEWITENAFDDSFNKATCILWVPKGCLDSYKESTGWQKFLNVKEIINGDVDLDEDVNDVDRAAMIDFIMDKSPEGCSRMLADLNDDDKVDAIDMVLLVDVLNTGRLSAEWQFNFDYVDNNQVVSSLACTLTNKRGKSIQLTKCELYCGQQLVSYVTYNNSQSVELAPGESKKCSFENLSKLDSKNGFSVAWHYVYDSESYIYRCNNYQ